jgi:hypothetical protein
MNKGCVIAIILSVVVLIGCGGLVGGIIFLAFSLTSDAVQAADEFLVAVGEGRIQEAYQMTSPSFRQVQTEEEFAQTATQLGLNEFASATWTSRSVKNDVATLEGTVTNTTGGKNPLTVSLIREGERWRVLSFTGAVAGGSAEPAKKPMPEDDELKAMVSTTLADFGAAVRAENFESFYESTARLWQSQTSAEELQKTFQPFLDQQVDLAEVEGIDPVFDNPPTIDEDGVLLLTGYFPTESARVEFEVSYVYEHPDWKLIGLAVSRAANESAATE